MNKQLKHISRVIITLFLALFVALTLIQVVNADQLRANELNRRTTLNSLQVERGSILLADNSAVALSTPSASEYRFQRQYPQGPIYAPVTGYFSNYQGASGIESAMNAELSGNAGSQFFARINRLLSGKAPQGSSVQLTIDPKAQLAAYNGLEGMRGSVVAIDAETGDVLTLVSRTSYDPNLLASESNPEIIANYQKLEQDPEKPLYNRAIAGDLYHPGSIFKLITTAAALESGAYTAESTFDDKADYVLPGTTHAIRNYHGGVCETGTKVTLASSLLRSCNVTFADLSGQMNANAIPQMAEKFGFGKELQIPLKVTPSTVGRPVNAAQLALTSIGQFDVRVTPLQMAMMSAAIVNEGTQMKPNLIKDIITPDLRSEYNGKPEILANPISKNTADTLKTIMQGSVSNPAGLAPLAAIPGAKVGGKTGTAEVGKDANGKQLPFTLWFTGFAEANGKKITVAVVVEDGGGALHNFNGTSSRIPTVIGRQVMEAVLSQ